MENLKKYYVKVEGLIYLKETNEWYNTHHGFSYILHGKTEEEIITYVKDIIYKYSLKYSLKFKIIVKEFDPKLASLALLSGVI